MEAPKLYFSHQKQEDGIVVPTSNFLEYASYHSPSVARKVRKGTWPIVRDPSKPDFGRSIIIDQSWGPKPSDLQPMVDGLVLEAQLLDAAITNFTQIHRQLALEEETLPDTTGRRDILAYEPSKSEDAAVHVGLLADYARRLAEDTVARVQRSMSGMMSAAKDLHYSEQMFQAWALGPSAAADTKRRDEAWSHWQNARILFSRRVGDDTAALRQMLGVTQTLRGILKSNIPRDYYPALHKEIDLSIGSTNQAIATLNSLSETHITKASMIEKSVKSFLESKGISTDVMLNSSLLRSLEYLEDLCFPKDASQSDDSSASAAESTTPQAKGGKRRNRKKKKGGNRGKNNSKNAQDNKDVVDDMSGLTVSAVPHISIEAADSQAAGEVDEDDTGGWEMVPHRERTPSGRSDPSGSTKKRDRSNTFRTILWRMANRADKHNGKYLAPEKWTTPTNLGKSGIGSAPSSVDIVAPSKMNELNAEETEEYKDYAYNPHWGTMKQWEELVRQREGISAQDVVEELWPTLVPDNDFLTEERWLRHLEEANAST